jgi:hypothetical protein
MRLAAVTAFLIVIAAALPLKAQRSTLVAIPGTIVDQTGAVLPGAQVELRSAASDTTFMTLTTTTDEAGIFRFPGVPSGRYDVIASFQGFAPTTIRVTVGTRAPAALRITMPLATITQEVTVGQAPTEIRTDAVANLDSSTVDEHTLENLPVFNQDVIGTMSRFLDASALGTNGVTLLVNGIEVNALTLSASAIQQIKINQDPYAAEFRQPGPGRIEVITKPGSQEFSGVGNLIFRDAALDARNAFAAERPPEQRRIVEGFLGGPVRHAKDTAFTVSLKHDAEDTQSVVVAQDLTGLVRANVANPYRNLLAAGTVTHQKGEHSTIALTASYQDETRHNQSVGGTTLPSAGVDWHSIEQDTIYSQQTVVSPKLLNQFRLLVGHEYEDWTSVTRAPTIVVLDAFIGGGAQADRGRTEHHVTVSDTLTWSTGQHVVKGGFQVPDWSRRRFDDNTNMLGSIYFSTLSDYLADRPYSLIQQAGNGHVVFLEKVLGGFVQDEIRARPNLSVVLGIRYDWQNYFHDTNNLAPRLSLAFAPDETGKTVIRAGSGLFYDRSGPGPIQDLIKYDGQHLNRYQVIDPAYPAASPVASRASQPPNLVMLAPTIAIPASLQWSVSLERRLRKGTSASVTYSGTRGFDQFRSRDLNAPTPPLFLARPDAAASIVREIESAGTSRVNSVQFTVKGQLAPRVSGSVQYTLSRAMNDTSGVTWMPPNNSDLSLEYARADFDQRHRFDLMGTLNPGSFANLGVALALYSGRPYSLTTGHDDFNTGFANARPAYVLRNSLEGPGYADLDLRWSRDMYLSGTRKKDGPTATLGVDAFNVLNHVNYSRYIGTLTSPFFGQAISAQAARRIQASVRLKF